MIPLRDENPTDLTPYVTWFIIAVNAIVFLLQMSHTTGEHLGLIQYAMVPRELTSGTQVGPFPPIQPAWLTIFTSMFMHGGILHIGSNMLYLFIFGNNIEDRLGHLKFLLFYLASGFVAALCHILSAPSSTVPTLGASGAVAGVLGAYMLLYPGASVLCLMFRIVMHVPAVVVLGYWIVLQLLSVGMGGGGQMDGGIAYWAHIGGFFGGMLLLVLMGGFSGGKRRYRRRW